MKTSIEKWGDSAGIRLTSPLLSLLQAKIGDSLEITVSSDALILRVIKPKRKKYTLNELLAEIPEGEGLPLVEGWDEMPDLGQENIPST